MTLPPPDGPGRARIGPVALPRPGSTLGGHRVERELARGGAGAVFVARDPQGRPVALKVLLAGWRGGASGERFRREGELGLRLTHPGIVRVLGSGEQDGQAWLAMELLEGARPMDAFAAERGLDARARVELVVQACDAIQHAHEQGAIHRDLKPHNLLVLPDGRVKVVDLGLARLVDEQRLTASGATMGTVEYMAPEQVKGDTAHADARADVWALGVVLFELLAGRVPFQGETPVEVMRGILEVPAPDLRRLAADLPRGLAAVVAMALEKAPDARHPSAVALGRDLAAVLAGNPESSAGWARARAARGGRVRRGALLVTAAALVLAGALAAGATLRECAAVRAAAGRLAQAAARCDELLRPQGPLAEAADVASLVRADLDAARATGRADAGALAAAEGRLAAVEGLLALASGDAARAQERLRIAGEGAEARVLEAGVAALTSLGGGPAALRRLEEACQAGQRPELRLWHALAALSCPPVDAGTARRALDELQRARPTGAAVAAVRVGRARALVALGRVDDAAQALGGEPAPPDLTWTLGLVAAERAVAEGDVERADAALAPVAGATPPAELRASIGALAGRTRSRLDGLLRPLAGSPARQPLLGQLLAGVRLLLRLEPERPPPSRVVDVVLDGAAGYRDTGDVRVATALADLVPSDYTVQKTVGLLGDRQRAVTGKKLCLPALRRAIELAPPADLLELGMRLCSLLATTGNDEECLAACERFLPLARDDVEARALIVGSRGRAYRQLGDPEGAVLDLGEAILLTPLDPKHRYERAIAHQDRGDLDGAFEDAMYAVDMLPDAASIENDRMVAIVWDVGRAHPRAGRPERVRRAVQRLLDGRQMYSGWWLRLALLDVEAGDLPGAAARLETSLEWFPREDDAQTRALGDDVRPLVARVRAGAPDAVEALRAMVAGLDARRGPRNARP